MKLMHHILVTLIFLFFEGFESVSLKSAKVNTKQQMIETVQGKVDIFIFIYIEDISFRNIGNLLRSSIWIEIFCSSGRKYSGNNIET